MPSETARGPTRAGAMRLRFRVEQQRPGEAARLDYTGVDVNVGADLPPRRIIISWRNPDGTLYGVDKDDDSLDDGTSSGSKLIEHEANPKPPDKD